jgi:hypothetical protein
MMVFMWNCKEVGKEFFLGLCGSLLYTFSPHEGAASKIYTRFFFLTWQYQTHGHSSHTNMASMKFPNKAMLRDVVKQILHMLLVCVGCILLTKSL